MMYKWEAIAQDLTEERDRLLKENARLAKELRALIEWGEYINPHIAPAHSRDTFDLLLESARAALKSEKQ
jgi:hypothetical protein